MRLSNDPVNVFVFGDLVLDHVIEVTKKGKAYQSIGNEKVYDVRRRISTAGGAANCARALAALGVGRISLWGLAGHSPWGTFPEILKICHTIDGAHTNIIFHGIYDESRLMNTITRIVMVDDFGRSTHEARFDDITYVHATDFDITVALNHLENEYDDFGVDAIILNDLDMNALTPALIKGISNFASAKDIPLFIDPKRVWEKYKSIQATCVLPNLKEWCHIVDQRDRDEQWRHGLDKPDSLKRMATRSLRFMQKKSYHIIKCDKDGAVVIAPDRENRHSVYHIPPHSTSIMGELPHQIGAGDVLTAVLAREYVSTKHSHDPQQFVELFQVANWVVACYRQMDWHRMPNRREVERLTTTPPDISEEATITSGILYLPPTDSPSIRIKDVTTDVAGLVSVDETYKSTISDLLGFLSHHWESDNLRSVILTARGGSGKSHITGALKEKLKIQSICVRDFKEMAKASNNIKDAHNAIVQIWNALPEDTTGLLLFLDEAFSVASHLLIGEQGKMLLQAGQDGGRRTRFLLIDADYDRHKDDLSGSQFVSRCKEFVLPPISQRLWDIPYIFAAGCLKKIRKPRDPVIRITESVLVAVINWVLSTSERDQSPRNIFNQGGELVEKVQEKLDKADGDPHMNILTLSASDLNLSPVLSHHAGPKALEKKFFEFID